MPIHTNPRRRTDEVIDALAAVDPLGRHARGETVRAIATASGAPWLRVKRWLEAHGATVAVRTWTRTRTP